MKKFAFITGLVLISYATLAQQGSDIYLFNFQIDESQFSLSNARNITNTPGYDNQPYFMPDGQSLLFASDDGFGQTDIYRYNISARSERRLTFTPDSEYSPTPIKEGKRFSCIILERSGRQMLWQFPINGAVPSKVTTISPVGYHCWINDEELALFIVGDPNKLETVDIPENKETEVAENPGRTMLKIPGTEQFSFVDLSDSKKWMIKSYDTETKQIRPIIRTLKGSSDYTWTSNGILVSGDGKRLYKFDPKQDKDWIEMANLQDYGLSNFNRITISPKGDMMAVVVDEN